MYFYSFEWTAHLSTLLPKQQQEPSQTDWPAHHYGCWLQCGAAPSGGSGFDLDWLSRAEGQHRRKALYGWSMWSGHCFSFSLTPSQTPLNPSLSSLPSLPASSSTSPHPLSSVFCISRGHANRCTVSKTGIMFLEDVPVILLFPGCWLLPRCLAGVRMEGSTEDNR